MSLKISRRGWMRTASLAALGSSIPKGWSATIPSKGSQFSTQAGMDITEYEKPLFLSFSRVKNCMISNWFNVYEPKK